MKKHYSGLGLPPTVVKQIRRIACDPTKKTKTFNASSTMSNDLTKFYQRLESSALITSNFKIKRMSE